MKILKGFAKTPLKTNRVFGGAHNLVRATGIYIFITALLHILILLIDAIRNTDFSRFNYFSVLQAQLLFPGIDTGKISYIVSILLSFSIICLIFFTISRKAKK